jgi:hypothetical protein
MRRLLADMREPFLLVTSHGERLLDMVLLVGAGMAAGLVLGMVLL